MVAVTKPEHTQAGASSSFSFVTSRLNEENDYPVLQMIEIPEIDELEEKFFELQENKYDQSRVVNALINRRKDKTAKSINLEDYREDIDAAYDQYKALKK